MLNDAHIKQLSGTLLSLVLAGGAASVAAGSTLPDPLALGVNYVVPPHKPGAKVRTPEGMAPLLIEHLNKRVPVQPVTATAVDAQLVSLDTQSRQKLRSEGTTVIPTGYQAGIMAIMRTDTDIKRWEDLRGRTVCLAEGSLLAGTMQARYGATEKVFRAPADSLLDLRIGGCDAAVHDSTMLKALLEFPEWQKFSAQLPVQNERDLVFVVAEGSASLADALRSEVAQWQHADLLTKLTRQAVQDIAFEVYMDQEVPDCH